MARKWIEVAADKRFLALTPVERASKREQYFREVVLPRVPKGREDEYWGRFKNDSDKDIGTPAVAENPDMAYTPPKVTTAIPPEQPGAFESFTSGFVKAPVQMATSVYSAFKPEEGLRMQQDIEAALPSPGVAGFTGQALGSILPTVAAVAAPALAAPVMVGYALSGIGSGREVVASLRDQGVKVSDLEEILAAAGYGAAEIIPEKIALKRFGLLAVKKFGKELGEQLTEEVAKKGIKTVASGLGIEAAQEMTTQAGQSGIEAGLDPRKDFLSKETAKEIALAGASGAIGGAALGGGVSLANRYSRTPPQSTQPPSTPQDVSETPVAPQVPLRPEFGNVVGVPQGGENLPPSSRTSKIESLVEQIRSTKQGKRIDIVTSIRSAMGKPKLENINDLSDEDIAKVEDYLVRTLRGIGGVPRQAQQEDAEFLDEPAREQIKALGKPTMVRVRRVPKAKAVAEPAVVPAETPIQQEGRVLSAITKDGVSIADIPKATGLSDVAVNRYLTSLQLKGKINRLDGSRVVPAETVTPPVNESKPGETVPSSVTRPLKNSDKVDALLSFAKITPERIDQAETGSTYYYLPFKNKGGIQLRVRLADHSKNAPSGSLNRGHSNSTFEVSTKTSSGDFEQKRFTFQNWIDKYAVKAETPAPKPPVAKTATTPAKVTPKAEAKTGLYEFRDTDANKNDRLSPFGRANKRFQELTGSKSQLTESDAWYLGREGVTLEELIAERYPDLQAKATVAKTATTPAPVAPRPALDANEIRSSAKRAETMTNKQVTDYEETLRSSADQAKIDGNEDASRQFRAELDAVQGVMKKRGITRTQPASIAIKETPVGDKATPTAKIPVTPPLTETKGVTPATGNKMTPVAKEEDDDISHNFLEGFTSVPAIALRMIGKGANKALQWVADNLSVEEHLRSFGKAGGKFATELYNAERTMDANNQTDIKELHDAAKDISHKEYKDLSFVVDPFFSDIEDTQRRLGYAQRKAKDSSLLPGERKHYELKADLLEKLLTAQERSIALRDNPKSKEFRKSWRVITDRLYSRLVGVGAEVKSGSGSKSSILDHYVKEYLRHQLSEEARVGLNDPSSWWRESAVQWLIETKQASNWEEASAMIETRLRGDASKHYGSAERSREGHLPPEFFEYDFSKLAESIIRKTNEYSAISSAIGVDGKKGVLAAESIRKEVAQEKGFKEGEKAAQYAKDFIKQITDNAGLTKTERVVRRVSRGMSASILSGISFPIKNTIWGFYSTARDAGVINAVRAYAVIFNRDARLRATNSGSIEAGRRAVAEWSLNKGVMNILTAGTNITEWINRTHSSVATILYAQDMLNVLMGKSTLKMKLAGNFRPKLLARNFFEKQMRMKPEYVDMMIKRGYLTEENMSDFAYAGARNSQGTTGKLTMPLWANNSYARSSLMFKVMLWQQTRQVVNHSIANAKQGNFGSLAVMLIGGAGAGEAVKELLYLLYGKAKPISKNIWDRISNDLTIAGSLGLLSNFMQDNTMLEVVLPVQLDVIKRSGELLLNIGTRKDSPGRGLDYLLKSINGGYRDARKLYDKANKPLFTETNIIRQRGIEFNESRRGKQKRVDYKPTEITPFNRQLAESISSGDPTEIKAAVHAEYGFLMARGMSPNDAVGQVKRAITNSSPLAKVGVSSRLEFRKWLRENAPADSVAYDSVITNWFNASRLAMSYVGDKNNDLSNRLAEELGKRSTKATYQPNFKTPKSDIKPEKKVNPLIQFNIPKGT